MSEIEVAGASLPEGIQVDETAAYFGITDSSDIIHELQQMDRHAALSRFIELTADLHLSNAEFDFEAASERLNCEGGEIYYLVVSHFGFAIMSDELRLLLGMEDSEGQQGSECQLPADQIETLTNLLSKFSKHRFIEWVKTNPVPINQHATYLSNAREIAISCVKGGKATFNSCLLYTSDAADE